MTNWMRYQIQSDVVDRCIDERNRQVATAATLSAWDTRWYIAEEVWDRVAQQLWSARYRGLR